MWCPNTIGSSHSPSLDFRLPSVIALKEYVSMGRRPAFTRFNVFLRDAFHCQYCGDHFPAEHLTFDHVIPRSRGGRTSWGNVVTACGPCNLQKGHRLPKACGMEPLRAPEQPTNFLLQEKWAAFRPITFMKAGVISYTGTRNCDP